MTETGTALAIPEGSALEAMFRAKDGVDPLIDRIKAEVRTHAADVTTKKGRDAIASLAHKVSRSKVALDDAGKLLTEAAKKEIAIVDAARKKVRDQLDALRDEVRKPLTDWEEAEASRIDMCKRTIAAIINHGILGDETSSDIRAKAEEIKAIVIGPDFGEYEAQATGARDATLNTLRAMYAAAKAREDQAAELEKLRAENARLEAERLEREAAAQAERDAEAARKAAAEQAERERIAAEEAAARIEAGKLAAAEKAKADAEAKAEADRIEAEARHEAALASAKREAEEAAQRERDRIAAEQKAADDARAKREADAAHRAKITADIVEALGAMSGRATPALIAEALIDGRIPHCRVVM